ncbi:nitrogen permease regulator 2 [Neoconidiobolus thromboides FSU 785]|nr:nitrogen permease regulator 2 [Neoconidiobolus thromboides FSU 785]
MQPSDRGFPRLLALFYCEFHPIQGPKVVYEIPENSISGASKLFDFELISDYIIPKSELNEHLITVNCSNYKIIGYPITIKNRKYERNALMFNLCWVFNGKDEVKSFEPIIGKMGLVLKGLEIEEEVLSDLKKKHALLPALEHILEDLNSMCESRITLCSFIIIIIIIIIIYLYCLVTMGIINLKLFPSYNKPKTFKMCDVPSPLADLNQLADDTWDISIKKILPFINGINHVKKITLLCDTEPLLVMKSLEHLIYYGCIIMIDIFQYSNRYSVNPNLKNLIEDIYLQKECIKYVAGMNLDLPTPNFSKLLSLYCALRPGETLLQWIQINQVECLNLDVRRFITFGIINKLIYRIHKFPILQQESKFVLPNNIKKYLNGKHHYDEICTEFNYSPIEMDKLLMNEPNVKFIYK